jgi:hypothetical protein
MWVDGNRLNLLCWEGRIIEPLIVGEISGLIKRNALDGNPW